MNVMGIIFANDASIGALTEQRTMASLPFGGRYRQVDFALSNLCAAGVTHVGIITRHNYQSLINHVGSGEEWGLELAEGGLEYLTPYAMSAKDSYRGKLESLHNAKNSILYGNDDELAVIIDSAIVSNIDLNDVIKAHLASGKDITVVTKDGITNGSKMIDLALKLDDHGEIVDIAVDYAAPADYLASMDILVCSKKWLMEKVEKAVAHDTCHMDRNLIMGGWQKGEVSVNVYQFLGVALYNESMEEYYHNSLALVCKKTRHDVFHYNHPVFTKVRDRVPCYYGEGVEINDVLLADGCVLEGKVENSVLFRQITVGAGAEVSNCVIMNDCVIGEGAKVSYAILDKNVTVTPGAVVCGTKNHPIVIKKGETV